MKELVYVSKILTGTVNIKRNIFYAYKAKSRFSFMRVKSLKLLKKRFWNDAAGQKLPWVTATVWSGDG